MYILEYIMKQNVQEEGSVKKDWHLIWHGEFILFSWFKTLFLEKQELTGMNT